MASRYVALLVVLAGAIATAVAVTYVASDFFHISVSITTAIYVAIAVVGGVLIIDVIARFLRSRTSPYLGRTAAEGVALATRIIGYTILAVLALTAFHVAVSSALFGGTVVGLVLGLALQTSLSNVIAGIFLILSRPFNVGDRVTMTTWQYGFSFPTTDVKRFSADYLIPGFTGVVSSIGLMYTTLITDENVPVKIPNNVVIQAAILVHNEEYRLVRVRFQVPRSVDPEEFIPAVKERLKPLPFMVKEPEVKIDEVAMDHYILLIDAYCKGQYEDTPKSEILKTLMALTKEVQVAQKK